MTEPMIARLLEDDTGVGAVIENDWGRVRLRYPYIDGVPDSKALEFYDELVDQINGVGDRPTAVLEVVRYRSDWIDRIVFIWIGWVIHQIIAFVLAHV